MPSDLRLYRQKSRARIRAVLMDWRARHPLIPVCAPLADELHTHVEENLTNYEYTLMAKWERQYE